MGRSKTDSPTPKPNIDKYQRVPEGSRVLVELPLSYKVKKLDGTVKTFTKSVCKIKEGTVSELNLTLAPDTTVTERPNAGAKGTKSFKLVLDKRKTIGGAQVKTLSIPVPGAVTLGEFYKWAKTLTGVEALITPGGRRIGFKIETTDDVVGARPDDEV